MRRHSCLFRESWSGCEKRLPFLWLHGEPGRCPHCGGAWRSGAVEGLSAEEQQETVWSQSALNAAPVETWWERQGHWRCREGSDGAPCARSSVGGVCRTWPGVWGSVSRASNGWIWPSRESEEEGHGDWERMCGSGSPMRGWWCQRWRQERETSAWIRWEKQYQRIQQARACWVHAWEERGAALFARSERSGVSCSLGA